MTSKQNKQQDARIKNGCNENMKFKDFEDFLGYKHCQLNPEILDDDLPDAYEAWISDLSIDEWIELGDAYKNVKEE